MRHRYEVARASGVNDSTVLRPASSASCRSPPRPATAASAVPDQHLDDEYVRSVTHAMSEHRRNITHGTALGKHLSQTRNRDHANDLPVADYYSGGGGGHRADDPGVSGVFHASVAAGTNNSTRHADPRARGAAAPQQPPPMGGGGAPSLPAFQLQVSLLMDQQRAMVQRSLKACVERIDSAVSKLDERLARVESTCARLDSRVDTELKASDADRSRLQQQLEAVAEERDRYLRRIVNPSAAGGNSSNSTAPSPTSAAHPRPNVQVPPLRTLQPVAAGSSGVRSPVKTRPVSAPRSQVVTPPRATRDPSAATLPPPPPPFSPPSATTPLPASGTAHAVPTAAGSSVPPPPPPATAPNSSALSPSKDAIDRLSRAIGPKTQHRQ